jgi:3-phosphoshikimate 1-carboxyvinyltransferase
MTVQLMRRFGVEVELKDGLQHIYVPANQCYKSPGTAYVEGDASSASYFLAGATITGGTVTVEGCGSDSLQGDVRFAEVMELMGGLHTQSQLLDLQEASSMQLTTIAMISQMQP